MADLSSTAPSAPAVASSSTPKAPRSQFLQKLHSILENPIDPNGLRWVTDDSFEISSKDAIAIHALSPAFEFHSLSSFIRQLSYYSFRRLSDRRRSTERRNSNPGYILFSHPSGFFVRGDPGQLTKIVRKARTRPEKGRRASECSTASDEGLVSHHPYPMPAWPPVDYRSSFSTDRPTFQLPSFGSSFNNAVPPRPETTQWRAYAPSTGSWFDPNRDDADRYSAPPRRASLGEFKLSPSGAAQPAPYQSTLSSLQEERPRLRKSASSLCVTTGGEVQPHDIYGQQQTHDAAEQGFRSSPYPTPTFSPTTASYFPSAAQTVPPQGYLASGATGAYTTAPHHSHLTHEPSPFTASYQPVAPKDGGAPQQQPYQTPSPEHSPLQEVVGLPALSQTVPPLGHPAHPATAASGNGADLDPRSYALLQQHSQEGQSPRSSYAPLPPMQSRYSLSGPSSAAHWQPHHAYQPQHNQPQQQYNTSYGYAPPPSQNQPQQQAQWSPAAIRSAY
ncbi:hypothetical protein JCM10450v2_007732 [Rhodotorula kratochvilovae]